MFVSMSGVVLDSICHNSTRYKEKNGIRYKISPVLDHSLFEKSPSDIKVETLDGERSINKMIFDNLFLLKSPLGFEKIETVQLPFSSLEFDNFFNVLSQGGDYSAESIVDYLAISNFLMLNPYFAERSADVLYSSEEILLSLKKRYNTIFSNMPVDSIHMGKFIKKFLMDLFGYFYGNINEKILLICRDPLFLEELAKYILENKIIERKEFCLELLELLEEDFKGLDFVNVPNLKLILIKGIISRLEEKISFLDDETEVKFYAKKIEKLEDKKKMYLEKMERIRDLNR